MTAPMANRFTGRHITAIMVCFFGVVVTVNLVMARLASGTFGGVVVQNSYVASQHFNRWLDEAAAESALRWSAGAARRADGRVAVTLSGPVAPTLSGVARHPLGRLPDRRLTFTALGGGRFISDTPLAGSRWLLRLDVHDRTRTWHWEGEVR